jgi:hypothetical protein
LADFRVPLTAGRPDRQGPECQCAKDHQKDGGQCDPEQRFGITMVIHFCLLGSKQLFEKLPPS